MKILLTIPDNIYLKIIEDKADKRTMMTAIKSGQTLPQILPEDSRLLTESEIITALEAKKKEFEATNQWNRVYGMMVAKNVVKGCKGVTL